MNPDNWQKDETPKSFYSPLDNDFTITVRDETNAKIKYVIPALKISTYPTYLADNFIKHIVDEVINKKDLGYVTPEDRKKIEQEVLI